MGGLDIQGVQGLEANKRRPKASEQRLEANEQWQQVRKRAEIQTWRRTFQKSSLSGEATKVPAARYTLWLDCEQCELSIELSIALGQPELHSHIKKIGL